MLMRLALVPTAEAVALMVTEEVAAPMVAVEVVASAAEDSEDTEWSSRYMWGQEMTKPKARHYCDTTVLSRKAGGIC